MEFIIKHLRDFLEAAIILDIFVALLFNAFIGDGALHDYVSQLFTAFAG